MRWLLPAVSCLLTGCDALPRDPDQTVRAVVASKRFSIASLDARPLQRGARVVPLVAELERRTGATAQWRDVSGEKALQQLTDGKLDLVIGHFRRDSPWQTEVAFGPPLAVTGSREDPIELKPAMRNGENRWVMVVERAARTVSAQARQQ